MSDERAILMGISPDYQRRMIPVATEKGLKKRVKKYVGALPEEQLQQEGEFRLIDLDDAGDRDVLIPFIVQWFMYGQATEVGFAVDGNMGKLQFFLNEYLDRKKIKLELAGGTEEVMFGADTITAYYLRKKQ